LFYLIPAPAIFCKVTDVFRDYFRRMGIRCASHVDDFVFVWSSYAEAVRGTEFVCRVFEEAGVLINREKSVLEPSQCVDYLGLTWNGERGTVRIPKSLGARLVQASYGERSKPLRRWGHLVGIAGWWRQVFPGTYGLLSRATNFIRGKVREGWDTEQRLPGIRLAVAELLRRSERTWRRDLVDWVYSDSSDSGGGWISRTQECAFGWGDLKNHHINLKEAVAMIWAGTSMAKECVDFGIGTDNTSALSWLRKGCCLVDSKLNNMLVEWSRLVQDKGLTVTYSWIPSGENPADRLSRIF